MIFFRIITVSTKTPITKNSIRIISIWAATKNNSTAKLKHLPFWIWSPTTSKCINNTQLTKKYQTRSRAKDKIGILVAILINTRSIRKSTMTPLKNLRKSKKVRRISRVEITLLISKTPIRNPPSLRFPHLTEPCFHRRTLRRHPRIWEKIPSTVLMRFSTKISSRNAGWWKNNIINDFNLNHFLAFS